MAAICVRQALLPGFATLPHFCTVLILFPSFFPAVFPDVLGFCAFCCTGGAAARAQGLTSGSGFHFANRLALTGTGSESRRELAAAAAAAG